MQIVKVTKTDDQKELNGIWVDYGEVELLIARFPTDEASRILNQMRRTRRRRDIDITSKSARRAIINLTAERVLLDWKKVKCLGDNGELEDLPYTTENCKALLKVDPDLLDFVSDFSGDIDNYMREDEDKTVGE